jgi:hypothetical protein
MTNEIGSTLINQGGNLAGAVVGGKGAKGAAQIQAQTADKALAFAREQEAAKKAAYDQSMKSYESRWNAWQGQRTALLQRYGVDIAPPTHPDAAASPGAATGGATAASGVIPAASANLSSMALSPGEQAQGSPAMSAAALPKWNDWAGMGLRQA